MNSNELKLLFEFAQNKGCKFTTITYRSSESGELARHTLLFGVDYKNALEHDLKFLERLLLSVNRTSAYVAPAQKDAHQLKVQAVTELLEGIKKSLAKYDGDTLSKEAAEKDVYENIFSGVKRHKDTGVYYIWAAAVSKSVIQSGTPKKVVNSKPLTVEKDRIRTKLRTNKYRQFRLENIGKAVLNGNTLIIE